MSQPICVLCTYYHPQADTHQPDREQTCPRARRRLVHDLQSLRSALRRLMEKSPPEIGARDGVSHRLPAASVPGLSKQPRVSGTRERRIPLTDAADLTAVAQPGAVSDPHRDQAGRLPVASMLREWACFWRDALFRHQPPPPRYALDLIDWMLHGRMETAIETEPALDDFVREIRELRHAVRAALGEAEPRYLIMLGVSCPRCGRVAQLRMHPDDPDLYRECGKCGLLLTPDEYHQHVRALARRLTHRQGSTGFADDAVV